VHGGHYTLLSILLNLFYLRTTHGLRIHRRLIIPILVINYYTVVVRCCTKVNNTIAANDLVQNKECIVSCVCKDAKKNQTYPR